MATDRFALISWIQEKLCVYEGITIRDFTESFADGFALLAFVHSINPSLVDLEDFKMKSVTEKARVAFSLAQINWSTPSIIEHHDFAYELDESSMIIQ
eukprot:CAMPEP_0168532430 /NCGR_PEP_ID=MMETSP0405-20121227/16240_1 /TAXON_ID=498012 /ORGANISM="Trichosphaerium sp, Strain Am-I-7 wt" /LENGTH=97 /DNA_ID=CAMNT_0008557825 /DNA_START=430 /DNA_END=720 /DNA_ORIENTATION=+